MPASRAPQPGATATAPRDVLDPRRWWVLGVVAACQLLVVLSASVVNIALPQMQRALDIADTSRPWVVTAYTLGVGGFLLLGGRVADDVGRRKVLVTGLVGFAVASGVGGVAGGAAVLFAARGAQGMFAALMTPAALSLLSVTFTHPRERATALVYGLSGAGAGRGSATTILLLAAAVALLVAFVVIEARSRQPLLPLRIVRDRTRAGAFLSMLLASAGLLGTFLFLTYYLQGTLHCTALVGVAPEEAGVAGAMVSTSQQVGGSLGTALLNTVAATATAAAGAARIPADALVHGYRVAFLTAAAVLGGGAVAAAVLVRSRDAGRPGRPSAPSFSGMDRR